MDMKNLPLLLATLTMLALAPEAHAQSRKSSPAERAATDLQKLSGPLLKCPPDMAQWTVAFEYPEDKKKPDGSPPPPPLPYFRLRPAKVDTTRTRHMTREDLTDFNGCHRENWYVERTQYSKRHGESAWSQHEASSSHGAAPDPEFTPLPACVFRDVGWLTSENFMGLVDYAGRPCLVFLPGGANGNAAVDLDDLARKPEKLEALGAWAFVDEATRLPVAIRWQNTTRTFTFGTPPTAMLTLPQDLQDAIRKGEQGRARLFQQAARPY